MGKVWSVVILAVVLSVGIVAYSGDDVITETHPCTHPGEGTCPDEPNVPRNLHCFGCSDPEHSAGCLCVMDWPCGKEYSQTSYCSPSPLY